MVQVSDLIIPSTDLSLPQKVAVCDVQPGFAHWCDDIVGPLLEEVQAYDLPTYFFWVGRPQTTDTEASVRDYLLKNGASEYFLEKAFFVRKDYGFFRQWMDRGVSIETIVKIAQVLRQDEIASSDDLDLEWLYSLDPSLGSKVPMSGAAIELSPYLEKLNSAGCADWLTCGGGVHECLLEIEIWMRSLGGKVSRLKSITY